ncbi:MAG: tetratricopeptide repeat protein, partial [Myxococcaceae bacterium]|nr:tetratricopeptide repeat protein [Myxococcaceae bacterium]
RAYLDVGANEKAIEVCRLGCGHHPASVAGRVLWGKALIKAGKAAEAMQQFDAAIGIDKENPHAYNLISEVLLRQGLYRSAVPILRKAAALQPNDARIKQWLDQARGALAGGPAPVLYDETSVTTRALEAEPKTEAAVAAVPAPAVAPRQSAPRPARQSAPRAGAPAGASPPAAVPSADPDVFAAFAPAKQDPRSEPTVVMGAYLGGGVATETPTQTSPLPAGYGPTQRPGPPVPTAELPAVPLVASASGDGRSTLELPAAASSGAGALPTIEGALDDGGATGELPVVEGVAAQPPDPFTALMGARTGSTDTFRGLTSTFQALEEAEPGPLPLPLGPASQPSPAPVEPSVVTSGELAQPPSAAAPPTAEGGLLDEVVSAQSELPTSEFRLPGQAPAAPAKGSGGLLDEIPDESPEPPSANVEAPRVEFSPQATEAIAREYERELREKLEARRKEKTFLQRHGLKLALAAGLLVVGGGLAGSYLWTQAKHGGENLRGALTKGKAAINADTKEQYELGLKSLDLALTMDQGNVDAWAYRALARAFLYAEHGGALSDRQAALAALDAPRVREAHPAIVQVVEYLTADAAELTGRRQQLLGADTGSSLVEAQAGRVLLTERRLDEAFKHLDKAVKLDGRNLRALVGLGEYYLASQDYEKAATFLSTAESLCRFHPQRVLGLAEARLELGREAKEALSDLEELPRSAAIPAALAGRYALTFGRAQSAAGQHEQALKTLADGLTAHADQAFDFQMALGLAGRNAGRMAEAQRAYEEALKVLPRSEEAKEGLGRVLLARSRERELLERLKPEGEQRKVALVRGIAASRLGDTKRVRAELARTQESGKYPLEAVVYLALADASDDGSDKGVQKLEELVATARRHRATAQVALARVYLKRNELTKARAQLEEAAKDPQDYEANALLGQLYLEAIDTGVPPETALAPLQKAVERNGSHAPSRHLLARTFAALGQFPEAIKQAEAWTADNPGSEEAWVDLAFVLLHAGRAAEAQAAIEQGLKADSTSIEGFRVKAQVLSARGDGRAAFAALERANKLNPKDAETFCEIGFAFVRQGNPDTALKAFEAARRESPRALCGLVGPHHAKPSAAGARPTPKEELLALQKQAFAVWDKALVDASLARVLLEERDLKSALELAEAATRAAPASAPAWFALGEVARRQKNEAKALEAYAKAAEFDGAWAQARISHGDALARAGGDGPAKALGEYEAVLALSQNEAELARVKKLIATLKKQPR